MVTAVKPVKAKAAKEVDLDKIDPGKNYYVTLQLGCRAAWRDFRGPPSWTRNPKLDKTDDRGNTVPGYEHVPVVHEDTGPWTGKIVRGLAVAHNEWLRDNRMNEKPGGFLNRMILVLSYRETTDSPEDATTGNLLVEGIVKGITEGLAGVVKALKEK